MKAARPSIVVAVLALLTLLGLGTSAKAATLLFDFSTLPAGAGGTSEGLSVGGYTVTAHGYNSPSNSAHDLFIKDDGGDEKGIGLTSTLDNELTLSTNGSIIANYVQVDVSQIYLVSTNALIKGDSVTAGEKWDIYGSNTLGQIGTKLDATSSAADNTFITLPDWGSYKYISVAVAPQGSNHSSDNVLFGAIQVTTVSNPVPLPVSAWVGMMGLCLAAGAAILRRRSGLLA